MTQSALLADHTDRTPAEVITDLKDVIARARRSDDHRTEAAALVELGRARRALGHVDLAELSLRSAIDCGTSAPAVVADAHLVLASVLAMSGRNEDAFVHVTQAAQSPDEVLARSAELQRAVLLQRTGRLAAAQDIFDRNLPTLRDTGLTNDVARVLNNRGEIHARLGNRDQALRDYREAAALFRELGESQCEAHALQNAGWVHGLWGELPEALRLFDEVTDRLRVSCHDSGAIDISRAEALVVAGLDREALTTVTGAIERLVRAGCHVEAARGLLLAARAGRDIDADAAERHATKAAQLFGEHGAENWRLIAELEAMRNDPNATHDDLDRLIGELDRRQINDGVISARAMAAARAVASGDLDRAQLLIDRALGALGDDTALDIRLDTFVAQAVLAEARARPDDVISVVSAALGDIDRRIAHYGDGDARVAFRHRVRSLQSVAVRCCVTIGDIAQAVDFSERARRVELRSATRSVGARTSMRQRRLRAVATQWREVEADQGESRELRARHVQLRSEMAESTPAPSCNRIDERRRNAHGIVSLLDTGERLLAVRRSPSGAALIDLGDVSTIRSAVDGASSVMAAAARTSDAVSGALDRHLTVLDDRVGCVAQFLDAADDPLAVSGPGWTAAIPWRLLPSTRNVPVVVVPSTQWLGESRSESRGGRAVIVAGPGLRHAVGEAEAVASAYVDPIVLTDCAATPDAVERAMRAAATLHIVAHGRLDRGNPEWSTIELAGGALSVNRLRTGGVTPSTVVLSACHTAPRSGDDLLGFAGALFASGTRNVVASSGPLPDTESTVAAMVSFHRLVASGCSPAVALASAFVGRGRETHATNGLLVCLGEP